MITTINVISVIALFAGIGMLTSGQIQAGVVSIISGVIIMAIGRVLENLRDLIKHTESAYKELNTIRQDLQNEILRRRKDEEEYTE